MANPSLLPSVWDDQRNIDTLKSMWAEGASAAEIAKALGQGVSRMAVLGKVHRLKLEKREARINPKTARGVGNPGQPKVNGILKRQASRGAQGLAFKLPEARKQGLSAAEAMPLVLGRKPFREGSLPLEDEGVDVTGLVGFSDRKINRECTWIFGEPTGGAMCCGKPVVEGTQWCPEHHARVYSGKGSLE